MLNYPDPERFFENCLLETEVMDGPLPAMILPQVQSNPALKKSLLRTLRDIRLGADSVLARRKPAEETLGLTVEAWEHRWVAWAASRKAAFYSRAAMLMLGETEYFSYFVKTLNSSHNIVFLCSASDALQHATGRYLSGAEEDLAYSELASWWEQQHTSGSLSVSL